MVCKGISYNAGITLRGPDIPMHFFGSKLEQPSQTMGFVTTPLRFTAQGSLLDFWKTPSPGPDIRCLVLPMWSLSPLPSILVFQRINFSYSSSGDSVIIIRSSVYRFCQGHHVRNFCEKASGTVINSRGLRQKPWRIPIFTLNSSLRLQPTRNILLAFSYMLYTNHTRHSSTSSLRWAYQMTRLDTRSIAFSKSTKAMYSVLMTPLSFSCSWCPMRVASVVLRPDMEPNCMSSMRTCCRRTFLSSFL